MVGLESGLLLLSDPEEQEVVSGILWAEPYDAIIAIAQADAGWRAYGDPRAIFVIETRAGVTEAVQRDERGESRTNVEGTLTHLPRRHAQLAGREQSLIEIEALSAVGADLIVTADTDLLGLRDEGPLRELNMLTPGEAAVVVGTWSRAIHNAYVPPVGVNNGLYYWALARAMTPAAWRGFAALAAGRATINYGEEVFDLAESVLDHLSSMCRSLDQLVALYECDHNNDVVDELLDEFDKIVTGAWSIYDNLALLSGRFIDIDLNRARLHGPEWTPLSAKWSASMTRAAASDGRAAGVLAAIAGRQPYLEVSHKLRHTLRHRARSRPIRTRRGLTGRDEVRLWIAGDTLAATIGAVTSLGHDLADWGIELLDVPTAAGALEQRGWLDFAQFAPRVIAHAGWLANEIFKALDPASDPRISLPPTSGTVPNEPYFRPAGAKFEVAFSALADLVDWVTWPAANLRPYDRGPGPERVDAII